MENKIQQLTEKLYNEGVSKGKQVSEQLIADARQEAAGIIEQAKKEAEQLAETVRKETEEMKKNTLTEIRLAAQQMISDLKINIQNLVTAKGVAADIREAFQDRQYIQQLILAAVKSWKAGELGAVQVIVPADQEEAVKNYLAMQTENALKEEITVSSDSKLENGFRLAPQNGGYYISFTDEDFIHSYTSYLRPATRKLLYEGE